MMAVEFLYEPDLLAEKQLPLKLLRLETISLLRSKIHENFQMQVDESRKHRQCDTKVIQHMPKNSGFMTMTG